MQLNAHRGLGKRNDDAKTRIVKRQALAAASAAAAAAAARVRRYARHSSNPLGLERLKLFPSGGLKGPWRPGIFKDRPVKLQLEPRTTANSRVFPAYVGTISYPSLNPVSVPSFKSLSDYSPSQCDGAVILNQFLLLFFCLTNRISGKIKFVYFFYFYLLF